MAMIKSYTELRELLRNFRTWGDETIYDFNGIVHLWLALLDNLQENALQAELEDINDSMTQSQREFLANLAEYANRADNDD